MSMSNEEHEHILQHGKAICGASVEAKRSRDGYGGIDISHCVGNPCVDPEEGTCPKCFKIFLSRGVEVRLARRG